MVRWGLVCDLYITDEWSGKSTWFGGTRGPPAKPRNMSEPGLSASANGGDSTHLPRDMNMHYA